MTRVEQFERIRRDRRLEGLSIWELAKKHKVHRRVSARRWPQRSHHHGRRHLGRRR